MARKLNVTPTPTKGKAGSGSKVAEAVAVKTPDATAIPHLTAGGVKNCSVVIDETTGMCIIEFDPNSVYVGKVSDNAKSKNIGKHPETGLDCGQPMIASSGGFLQVDYQGSIVKGLKIGLNVLPENRAVIDHLAGIQRNLDEPTLLSLGYVPDKK